MTKRVAHYFPKQTTIFDVAGLRATVDSSKPSRGWMSAYRSVVARAACAIAHDREVDIGQRVRARCGRTSK
jgi:hypothetical protein